MLNHLEQQRKAPKAKEITLVVFPFYYYFFFLLLLSRGEGGWWLQKRCKDNLHIKSSFMDIGNTLADISLVLILRNDPLGSVTTYKNKIHIRPFLRKYKFKPCNNISKRYRKKTLIRRRRKKAMGRCAY